MKKLIMPMVITALLSGCANQPLHVPPGHILSPSEMPGKTLNYLPSDGATLVAKFIASYNDSYNDETEATKARVLTQYGMTLVDTRCDLFFEQIGRGAQRGDFIRREFQSLTAALIAALGLSSVGNDAITGVGIGSALGIQTLDNYSTVYFFSPDVSAVQKLVRRTLLNTRADMLMPERSPKSYDDAINALRIYQNICTAHEIKRLVTEAIDPDRPAITRFDQETPLIYSAAASRALKSMRDALSVDNIDLRQAVLIDMIQHPPESWSDEDAGYACFALAGKVRAAVCKEVPEDVVVDGQTLSIEEWVSKGSTFAPQIQPKIDAGMATLRALIPNDYSAMRSAQEVTVRGSAPEYRSRLKVLAQAKIVKSKSVEQAKEIARLEERLRQMSAPSLDAARAAIGTPEMPVTPATATVTPAPVPAKTP